MIYSPVIIIGSGPSGATAAYSLIEENQEVLMLDQGYNKKELNNQNQDPDKENNQAFHPKLRNQDYKFVTHNFINKNKIVQSNFFATGSLAFGGLSNIWGGGYWNYFNNFEEKSFNKFLEKNFEILNFDEKNSSNLNDYFNINNEISIYKTAQLLSLKNKKEIFNSMELILKLNESKNFNYKSGHFIDNVMYEQNFYILEDEKGNKFKCKYLILACGTIGSTRLVMKLNKIINIKQNLLHNITYGFVGKIKKKQPYFQTKKHTPNSIFIYEDKSKKQTISGSIGRYSYELNKFIKHKFLFPLNIIINSFFNIFKSYIIFGKIFLPVSYSDTKIFLDKDNNINIVGKKRNEIIQDELKLIDNFFYVNKNVFKKIYKKELPLGSDSHYTSTMSQDSEIEGLKTNNFGELITRKNLFIVDGSIIDKNGSYFPTFQIMHNAYKIAKYIIKKID
jgi:hypothetical protein